MSEYLQSTEELKSRMLRHASTLWGVKNTDALDPLVKILMEAFAGELQKTFHSIDDFEQRILEKLAVLMTPGLLSSPYCAHAIMHAHPQENIHLLKSDTHFQLKKKVLNEKDIQATFTPVDSLFLFDGAVNYIIAGDKAFSINEHKQKSILAQAKNHGSGNVVWLGLQLNDKINSFDKLRFYFDFKNLENKNHLLSLLPMSKWEINGEQIEITKGVIYENNERPSQSQSIFSDYDPMFSIENEIKYFYDNQFVTLIANKKNISPIDYKSYYPSEFSELFSNPDLSRFKDKCVWIKISTPASIDEKSLLDLHVHLNAFPAINRQLVQVNHRFKGSTNIVPIKPDLYEYFLSVRSLSDSKGIQYSQIPYSDKEMKKYGTYSVRKSGTERIDTRTAREYLNYLTELVRDESAAFSSYGQDSVGMLIRDMDKTLAQLELRVQQNKNSQADAYHYISLEFQTQQEDVSLSYWITNSDYCNMIHAGTKLKPYQGSEIKSESVVLLSTTIGGKKPMAAARHMDAYKYAMLSHNRIITVEDIKAFCMYELGDKISQVDVRKAVVKSSNPKEGLVRCVEILLKKKSRMSVVLSKEEWEHILKETKSKFDMRSSINLNCQFTWVD